MNVGLSALFQVRKSDFLTSLCVDLSRNFVAKFGSCFSQIVLGNLALELPVPKQGISSFFCSVFFFILFCLLAVPEIICSMWDLQSSLLHMGFFSCGTWDLVPWPRIKPEPTVPGTRSLHHWTTREVPFFAFYFILGYRRRQWHPTLVLLPGKSHGWRSLEGCSPWGR